MAFCDRFRYVIALLILGSCMSAYIGRVNLSVAITYMAQAANVSEEGDVCPAENINSSVSSLNFGGQFDWNEKEQGYLLSSFFYAYVGMQIPGGVLIERLGPRLLTSIAIIITGLVGIATPYLAPYLWLFIASRVLMGFSQSMVFPGTYCLISRWIPPNERGTVIGLTGIGSSLGTIISTALSGYLCKHFSWESAFVYPGVIITIFGVVYIILINDHPKSHFLVSTSELRHIQRHIGPGLRDSVNVDLRGSPCKRKAPSFPWIKVLTSKIVWATIFVKFTNGLVVSFIGYKGPSYMKQVLRVDGDKGAYCIALISAISAVGTLVSGILADVALRCDLNKTTIRKVFQSVATFSIAIGFILLPRSDCDVVFFVVMLIVSNTIGAFANGGEGCIYTDLTTQFAGNLFAFCNGVSMIAAFSPSFFGFLLDFYPTKIKLVWSYIFYFIGASNVLGGLVFLCFVRAEPLNWDQTAVSSQKESQISQAESITKRRRSTYAIEGTSINGFAGK